MNGITATSTTQPGKHQELKVRTHMRWAVPNTSRALPRKSALKEMGDVSKGPPPTITFIQFCGNSAVGKTEKKRTLSKRALAPRQARLLLGVGCRLNICSAGALPACGGSSCWWPRGRKLVIDGGE